MAVNDGGVANSWQKSTVLGLWTDYASPEVPISLSSGNKPGDIDITAASGPYGFNGWLGLATLALDRKGHIDWATVKLNETYAQAFRLTAAQRQSVYCEELGHTLGLTHNHARRFGADTTCMNDRLWNPTPNWHDTAQLDSIYDHGDGYSSFARTATRSSPNRVTVIVPAPGRGGR